jgi:hypothetical protein
VRQREFDLWRGPWEEQIRDLQQWRREHERDHDKDEDDEVTQDREGRRERWRQFAAWMAVAAVLVAAWWTSAATR